MTIDIEKLADEFLHGTDRNGAYYGFVEDLKQFAESYAAKMLEDKEREIAELKEKHIMQLSGISTASIGYFKDGDGIHPDYDTVALRDVTCLYSKYETLFNRDKELQAHINDLREALEEITNTDPDEGTQWFHSKAEQALSKTPVQSLKGNHDGT